MRFIEICGGIQIPLSNEENKLYERVKDDGEVQHSQLTEREQTMAQKLVSRGALNYRFESQDIYFSINELDDIWRD